MKNKNINYGQAAFCLCSSQFGPVAVVWSIFSGHPKVFRILLSRPNVSATQQLSEYFPHAVAKTCSEIGAVADDIKSFLHGADIRFSLKTVAMDLCSHFQQKVLRAEHGIPRGAVSTYQRIARHVGSPKGARVVGNALAHNPFPLIVPCHRAIRTNRSLGKYQGGFKMKRTLLEMEGIECDDTGRVVSDAFFY